MNVVDDARLLELAQEPVRELLPTVRRASAMKPLVVLFAFLPGLLLFRHPLLDEATSELGLRALEISTAHSPREWLSATGRESVGWDSFPAPPRKLTTPTQSGRSPNLRDVWRIAPLPALATALSLRLELLSPESRVLLVPYLSSVFLLLALFGLATQLGGNRIAFAAVLLACCHREVLELSSRLPPMALAMAFGILAFRGMLVHQTDRERWLSWPLVGAGVALGASWLSGGFDAIGVWCVLCLQSLMPIAERSSSATRTLARAIRRRLLQGARGVCTAVVVSLIAASLGAAWLVGAAGLPPDGLWQFGLKELNALHASIPRSWPAGLTLTSGSRGLVSLSGALLGFVLLAPFHILRSSLAVNSRRFVLLWFAAAFVFWSARWTTHRGEFNPSVPWPVFLLLPLLVLAAHGLDGVLRRQFDERVVIAATVVALMASYARFIYSQVWIYLSWEWSGGGILVVLALVLMLTGWWACRRLLDTERRRRMAMLVCMASMVAADVVWGLSSLVQTADDERELLAFRRQLSAEVIPQECWLISEESPPARIRFFLQSLWPGTAVRVAESWEAMFTDATDPPTEPLPASTREAANEVKVVVTWGSQKWPAADLRQRGQTLMQATDPHYLQRRLLKAYRLIRSPNRENAKASGGRQSSKLVDRLAANALGIR